MLDIVAFTNAMRQGTVSFLRPLGLRPFEEASGEIVSFHDDDAVVFPVARSDDRPEFALRIPLDDASNRQWPEQYADLAATVGAIQAHLPAEITILGVEDIPGTEVALLYDWVPGETLTRRVTRSRIRRERDQLYDLLWPLADIAEAMRLGGMVHADIAPGNIVVRPDGRMTLIDLDRMGRREAIDAITPRRRPGYRIPRGGGDPVEEDAFGLLVLMASCAILADAPVPIDHERAPESSHPMLLFSSWDLMDPRRSRLVREIEDELTPLSKRLLDLLVDACTGPSDRIPALLREAVRITRRSVSPPDAIDAETVGTDWHVVPASPQETQTPTAVPHRPAETAFAEEHGAVMSWPKPKPLDVAQEESAPVADTNEGAARARVPETLQWQTTTGLVDMLQGLGERGVAIERPTRRGRRVEQRRQAVAAELQDALAHNDRDALVRLAMSGSLAELGESRRSDLLQVVRALSHEAISRAVASDDDGAVVTAIDDTVFGRDTDLDPVFRERVHLARSRLRWTDTMVEAIRTGDVDTCASLMENPPGGAVDRLPETVRNRARELVERHDAVRDAHEFIAAGDAEGLVRALGRLVVVSPAWTDYLDADAVEHLLGIEQIEHHLVQRLRQGPVPQANQWMVDMVIAAGRLPDADRKAGLTPGEVRSRIDLQSSARATTHPSD
ncbi:MAG TPA: hypothetical protein VGR22_02215 [Thermomicrobiales bacterium]|nr:hypothetical protein [Thermomicrobiales bacterium]